MERKIGEVFEYEGVKLEVVPKPLCHGCHFYSKLPGPCKKPQVRSFWCTPVRSDKTSVNFRKVEP